jgi:hypothetical protein
LGRDVAGKNFYITGEQGVYPVTNLMEMEDVEFTKGDFF